MALLREAAPQAVSKDKLGVLFDVETMNPRITEPPFVEALTNLAAGQRGTHAQDGAPESGGTPRAPAIGVEHTDSSATAPRPPVLGHADRLVGVTTSSHNAASAFKLISWLAQPDTSAQFARLGNGTLPPRISNAASPGWYKPDTSADDRAKFADSLTAQLNGERSLLIPRIPKIDDYLAALDAAVKSSTVDKSPPDETLLKTATGWEEITNSVGRDAQRDAYRKHLGISQ